MISNINKSTLLDVMDILHNIDYSAFQGQMMDEINAMMKDMVQVQICNSDTYRKYKLYECVYVDNAPVNINEKMCKEIEWLIHYVKETHLYLYEDYRDNMLEKFDRVTSYLPKLFDLYDAYTSEEDFHGSTLSFEPVETLKNIAQVLSPFRDCVNRETFDKDYVALCVRLLEYYKYNVNFMINRLAELEFDLEYMKTHHEYSVENEII